MTVKNPEKMFVVYHTKSGRLLSDRRYFVKNSAIQAIQKMDEYYKSVTIGDYVSDLAYMTAGEYFSTIGNQKITVKNLMTGRDVEIDINTPLSCDPSSETYWSM